MDPFMDGRVVGSCFGLSFCFYYGEAGYSHVDFVGILEGKVLWGSEAVLGFYGVGFRGAKAYGDCRFYEVVIFMDWKIEGEMELGRAKARIGERLAKVEWRSLSFGYYSRLVDGLSVIDSREGVRFGRRPRVGEVEIFDGAFGSKDSDRYYGKLLK
jgi:hypothetical protein